MSDQPVRQPVEAPKNPIVEKEGFPHMYVLDLRTAMDNLAKVPAEKQADKSVETKTPEQQSPEQKPPEAKTHEQQIKDKLTYLDHAPIDVEKTPGHQLVGKLEKGLQKDDMNALGVKKVLTDTLFTKVEHAHGVVTYEVNKSNYDEFRANTDMTKKDGDRLLNILQPEGVPLVMGEEGYVGSEHSVERQAMNKKVEAVLETKTTSGQMAAMNAFLHGASAEQIKGLGEQASTLEEALGGIAGGQGGQESIRKTQIEFRNVGRESTQMHTEKARRHEDLRRK